MLDPFTAFGLAANVVQFIDFGLKVVRTLDEIYASKDGLKRNYSTLDKVRKPGKLVLTGRSCLRSFLTVAGRLRLVIP
jgi:hypothetical protein